MENSNESRIIIRIDEEDKENLKKLAEDLGISLTNLIKKQILGDNQLLDDFFELIEERVCELDEGEKFTLKSLLGGYWKYINKPFKKALQEKVLEAIEYEEIDAEIYARTKNGKIKYKKISESDTWNDFDDDDTDE